MAVIFHTSVHFIFGGLPYLTERCSFCDFDKTVKCLSNDSQIIAAYAELLKYTVKFNMSKIIILKLMIHNFFVHYTYTPPFFIYNQDHNYA